MTDESAMTTEQQAHVQDVIDRGHPRRMRRPDGRELLIAGHLVPSRLAAGYEIVQED